jgi:HEAT repeat protein
MRAHGVRRLVVRQNASARDIGQLIGLLMRSPVGDDGIATTRALDDLHLWGVRLVPEGTHEPADALPPPVGAALEALATASDATRAEAAQALIAALTNAPTADAEARIALIARTLARAMTVHEGIAREALCAAGTTLIFARLADAVVSIDETVRADAKAAFKASGSFGVEMLVAHLAGATTIRRRRRCFEALLAVDDAVPTLIDALGHPQWYVVRNVAQVLGELGAEQATPALGRALLHRDLRVRVAVAAALDRIDAPPARAILQRALADESPEVRRLAARAYTAETVGGTVDGLTPAARMGAAFDRETDPDALIEMTRALGVIGTPDAVQRLIRVAIATVDPARVPMRLAALEALVIARGPAALSTLRALRSDRMLAVRDAVRQLELQIAA